MATNDKVNPGAKVQSQDSQQTSRARVLLVEDDKALRRFLEVILQRSGYEVIAAGDGLEAMKLALNSDVDIVVTDAMMPNLSGHEFCRFLRNSDQLSQLPIIMLSGTPPREGSSERQLADAFLSKPVSGDELKSCLESLLTSRK
jgi:DNA-binding response OmpR family regulator